MKIKNLEIENFKCFGQKQSLDFGRITLLTGANSSGKSSLMYAILACMQSNSFPFMLSLNGDYVNMGDFEETVFRNDAKKEIGIKIEFEDENLGNQIAEMIWESNKNHQPIIKKLSLIMASFFELKVEKERDSYKCQFLSYPINDNKVDNSKLNLFTTYISNIINASKELLGDNFISMFEDFINFRVQKIEINISSIGILVKGYQTEATEEQFLMFIVSSILGFIKSFKENINFSGAFRLSPQRGYLEKTQIVPKLAVSGEGYLDQILAWETEKSAEFKALKGIMRYLALTHDIKSKRSKGGKFEVLVKTKSNSVFSSLTDVGFGISNFLPIIVADLQLSNNSTLFVAQPETHLHPSVQSKFGEYLSSQINSTNKNYVVETHSEYLLNNIRLAIVKGEVKSEDVKIYYIEPDGTDRKIHHISFAKNGQILNAPKSFFDTYMIDVMNIALNATAE